MNSRICLPRFISALTEVVKKLWGYIRRKRTRVIINVTVNVCGVKKEDVEVAVDIDVDRISKDELIDSIATSAKLTKADAGKALNTVIESSIRLRTFKAVEPDI